MAAQILGGAGVDLNRARQQVINLLHGGREDDAPLPSVAVPPLTVSAPPPGAALESRLASFAARLSAIELRLRQSGVV